MKVRIAQHTVDCSGNADAAREAWRTQGMAWLALPGVGWKLVPLEPESPGWTWVSGRWGAELRVLHLVEPGPHGTRIHARAEVEGPLAWLHRFILRTKFRTSLPEALRKVARSVAAQAS